MPGWTADLRSQKLVELDKYGQIDTSTFQQILEMDDDEDEREFSKSIVYDFFDQANTTFQKMEDNLYVYTRRLWSATSRLILTSPICSDKKDLATLSSLGHFLKGSSATLGLTKVKDSCEKIQHFGARKDESGANDEPDDEVSLQKLETTIAQAKQEFSDVEQVLRKFYNE